MLPKSLLKTGPLAIPIFSGFNSLIGTYSSESHHTGVFESFRSSRIVDEIYVPVVISWIICAGFIVRDYPRKFDRFRFRIQRVLYKKLGSVLWIFQKVNKAARHEPLVYPYVRPVKIDCFLFPVFSLFLSIYLPNEYRVSLATNQIINQTSSANWYVLDSVLINTEPGPSLKFIRCHLKSCPWSLYNSFSLRAGKS